ncbi:hypothetical protein EJ08DRAFT_649104 [Tothia fuscella]|uniref:Uncharacterized protein n=1 Tax=Tothia fuscella TaxID=1048955 RepID=A0A9P4TZU8_9PEZI|nr:hypothetical protein EJ08DRAFT_649104 [Tothia fuscella]
MRFQFIVAICFASLVMAAPVEVREAAPAPEAKAEADAKPQYGNYGNYGNYGTYGNIGDGSYASYGAYKKE